MIWRLAGFLPGGQVLGILGAVASAIATSVRLIADSLAVVLANPIVLIVVAAAATAGVAFGTNITKHRVDSARSVAAAQKARLDKLQADLRSSGERRVAEAGEAAKAAPQPETSAEIVALCRRSASCRERAK